MNRYNQIIFIAYRNILSHITNIRNLKYRVRSYLNREMTIYIRDGTIGRSFHDHIRPDDWFPFRVRNRTGNFLITLLLNSFYRW